MDNTRRTLIKAIATGAAVFATPTVFGSGNASAAKKAADASEPFKLKYAPGIGMFSQHSGKDIVDNIRFCYDMGFRAMFDNGLMGRPVEDQLKISNEMHRLGMDLGPFIVYGEFGAPTFVLNKPEIREMLIKSMKQGVELAKRTGAKWALVVPGRYDEKLHIDFQTANFIDNLRYCCDVVESAGLTIVLEPLNTHIDHPGLFLKGMPQSYAICRAVNRSVCKINEDLYHQQITEGNLIPNMEAAWSEIGSLHCGDTPGRKEPTTGEINYKNVFKYIYKKNYQGVICMEHGMSKTGKEGEARVIQAYRECDSFEI